MPSPEITIRPATPDDLAIAAGIFVLAKNDLARRQSGRPFRWGPDESAQKVAAATDDLRLLHAADPSWVQVATGADDGDVLGFSGHWIHDGWWFLLYLFVRPEAQGRGIGRGLLERSHGLGRDAGCTVSSLFASDDPRGLYRYLRLGLSPQPPTLTLRADSDALKLPDFPWDDGLDALPLFAADPDLTARMNTVGDLDKAVRGARRPADLDRWLREGATGSLLMRRDTGAPVGYVLLHPRATATATASSIGPLVALDIERVPAVVTRAIAALSAHVQPGRTWEISLPGQNTAALPPLLAAGFRPTGLSDYLATGPIGQWDRYVFHDEDFL